MTTTTNQRMSVVAASTALLKDALRLVRCLTTAPECDVYMANLARDLLHRSEPRKRSVEDVLAIGLDAIERGAPLEDAEEFGYRYAAVMRAAYERKHGRSVGSLCEAHTAEQHAEGEMNDAETAMIYERTPAKIARFLQKSAAYRIKHSEFEAIVRHMHVERAAS